MDASVCEIEKTPHVEMAEDICTLLEQAILNTFLRPRPIGRGKPPFLWFLPASSLIRTYSRDGRSVRTETPVHT